MLKTDTVAILETIPHKCDALGYKAFAYMSEVEKIEELVRFAQVTADVNYDLEWQVHRGAVTPSPGRSAAIREQYSAAARSILRAENTTPGLAATVSTPLRFEALRLLTVGDHALRYDKVERTISAIIDSFRKRMSHGEFTALTNWLLSL